MWYSQLHLINHIKNWICPNRACDSNAIYNDSFICFSRGEWKCSIQKFQIAMVFQSDRTWSFWKCSKRTTGKMRNCHFGTDEFIQRKIKIHQHALQWQGVKILSTEDVCSILPIRNKWDSASPFFYTFVVTPILFWLFVKLGQKLYSCMNSYFIESLKRPILEGDDLA